MDLEVTGVCFEELAARGETGKREYLGVGNSKADPNKAAAACQIEFSI